MKKSLENRIAGLEKKVEAGGYCWQVLTFFLEDVVPDDVWEEFKRQYRAKYGEPCGKVTVNAIGGSIRFGSIEIPYPPPAIPYSTRPGKVVRTVKY